MLAPHRSRAPRPRGFVGAGLLALLALAATATAATAKLPRADLLGIRLGMDDHEARARLSKLGKPLSKLESPKQTWDLRDRYYGSLTIRYDPEWRVQWMTAFARPRGARVRYRDVGRLDDARRTGTYIYTWTIPTPLNGRATAVTARGTDSRYLSSISIHTPGPSSTLPPGSALPDSPH